MSKWRDTGQMTGWQILDIPPVWLLAALGLVWAQARFAPVLTGSFAIARVLAVALALGGVALAVWAVMAFRAHRTSVVPHQIPEALITTGPMSWSCWARCYGLAHGLRWWWSQHLYFWFPAGSYYRKRRG